MSDFEAFSGMDSSQEGFDPAAFERFKERMKAASAGLKAAQAGEQKARKKEDELIKILLRFIKSDKSREVLMLVVRLLEENVPAGFIVSLLLISNRDMQEELGVKLLPQAPGHEIPEDSDISTLPDHYLKESVLPLRIKMAIDAWLNEITRRAAENARRILDTILDGGGIIKLPVTQLAVFCLRDFLESEGSPADYDKLKDFMDLMLEGIIKKIREEMDAVGKLEGG
jgi:hypothetical protein